MSLLALDSLQDDVSMAKRKSPWESREFLPENKIAELFTKARIDSISTVRPESAFNTSLKVIAILLCMGEVNALDNWLAEGLTDDYLPVEYDEREKVFFRKTSEKLKKTFKPFSTRLSICKAFVNKQWEFLAPVFDQRDLELTKVAEPCPLPIIWRDHAKRDNKSSEIQNPCDQGAFGDVYKIKVHHAHLKPCREEGNEPKLAIKELRSDSLEGFEQEETALRMIHGLDDLHLIKVVASIKRGEKYHFLFPWADGGNLRRVWGDMDKKPRTAELIRWIFEQMKGIAGAIAKLHNPSNTSEKNGRHGDLKPENILFFPDDRRGTLVITDVGLTRFHNQVTNKRVNKTDTTDASIDYGPPEALNDDIRSRKYDIWSLGCIFLEFTIWIFGGIDEQENFKKARSGKSRDCPYYYNKKSPNIHPKVGVYINKLRNDSRCGDCAGFRELLNIIENDLLKINADTRLAASALEKHLEEILRKAEQQNSYLFSNPNGNGSFYPRPLPKDSVFGLNRVIRAMK